MYSWLPVSGPFACTRPQWCTPAQLLRPEIEDGTPAPSPSPEPPPEEEMDLSPETETAYSAKEELLLEYYSDSESKSEGEYILDEEIQLPFTGFMGKSFSLHVH